MRVLGIDPGVTGAWAVIEVQRSLNNERAVPPAVVSLGDLPTRAVRLSKRVAHRLDAIALDSLLSDILPGVDAVTVEMLTAPIGIASVTAFSLGWTAATIDSALSRAGARVRLVHPSKWKPALLVPADKETARRRATALFQSDRYWPRKSDHNRAEAALIGLYGALSN